MPSVTKKRPLSRRQRALVLSLSDFEWLISPLNTLAQTVLSLKDRGLIDTRVCSGRSPWCRYVDLELRLSNFGQQVKESLKKQGGA